MVLEDRHGFFLLLEYELLGAIGLGEKFPSLEALALDPTTLTARGLEHLPALPTVRRLHLDGTPFREGGLSYLCPEAEYDPSLKDHLGDEALAVLKSVPGLQKLWLKGLPITDESDTSFQSVKQHACAGAAVKQQEAADGKVR